MGIFFILRLKNTMLGVRGLPRGERKKRVLSHEGLNLTKYIEEFVASVSCLELAF